MIRTLPGTKGRATSFKHVIAWNKKKLLANEKDENPKHQMTNHKWFDKLTTLSQVEGQIATRGASACAARDRNSKFKTDRMTANNPISD